VSGFPAFRHAVQQALFAGLPGHIERRSWSADRIATHQEERLRSLLAHAQARSPFHARRLGDVDASSFRLDDLRELPVMTKADLMDAFDDVVADPRVTFARAEAALAATEHVPEPIDGALVCLVTGGSTGRRGVFGSDVAALAEFVSGILRGAMARRPARPADAPPPRPIAFVGAASAIHATGCASPVMAGSQAPFAPVPVTRPVAEMVALLNELDPPALFGYPSVLARLARERLAGRLRIAPAGVTCTSETLLPEYRAAIAAGFGVPIVDTYATTEGIVGSSDPDDPVITLASDGCIAELVDQDDRPVPPGTPSAAVLVTNLFNHVQPLIRYRLGDVFVRQPDAPGHGHLRCRIEGRSDDVLRYGPVEVHPFVLRTVLLREPAITDYVVVQTPRGVRATVQADGFVDLPALTTALRTALAGAGLADPSATVEAVPQLERHPATGKLRRFVAA
jgi:phenylacetate-coenzyme A ligase PaaK-like adenylate-forming protein